MLNNVAVVDDSQMYVATNIDFEQLANWDPEYIFFYNSSDPESIVDAQTWQGLTAVANGNYYEVPGMPYNFLSRPSITAIWRSSGLERLYIRMLLTGIWKR